MTDDTRTSPRLLEQLSSRAIEPIVRAVRTEIGRAKREVADRARSARTGIVLIAVGAVLALVTAGLLAAAVVAAVAIALPLWAATLVALGVFGIASTVVVRVGIRAIGRGVPPVPKDTIAELGDRTSRRSDDAAAVSDGTRGEARG